MYLILTTISALLWFLVRSRRELKGLYFSAVFLLIFGSFAGDWWNTTRFSGGAGLPSNYVSPTGTDTPAAQAIGWASAGMLCATFALSVLLPRVESGVPMQLSQNQLTKLKRIVQTASIIFLSLWCLGQGESIWSRETYLESDGIDFLLRATFLVGPSVGAVAMLVTFFSQPSRSELILAYVLGISWWVLLTSVGTRIAVIFPLLIAVTLAYSVVRRDTGHGGLARIAILVLFPAIALISVVTFMTTLESRMAPHGLVNFWDLSIQGWSRLYEGGFETLRLAFEQLVASLSSGYPITNASVLNAPDQSVLWGSANPLPSGITGTTGTFNEMLYPFDWVPLSMIGQWFGAFGTLGQFLLYLIAGLLTGFVSWHACRKRSDFMILVATALTLLLFLTSVQYGARWFWRLFSILILLPFVTRFVDNILRGNIRRNSKSLSQPAIETNASYLHVWTAN